MSKLVRWNPMRETLDLVNEFDRMLETPFFRMGLSLPNRYADTPGYWGLAVDVAEQDENFIVKASIPGINPEDLEITFEDNVLTIQGEVKSDETIEEANYHMRERRYGRFSRSLRFPTIVNSNAVVAEYENGVLTLTVPKAEEVKPKKIAVKVN